MDKSIWKEYDVTFLFLTQLCGSVPADPEIVAAWIAARQPKARPAGGKSIVEVQEEVFSTLVEGEEPHTGLIFQRVDGVCCLRAATVRAHLKDCSRVMSAQYVGKVKGERSFATKVINGVYLDENEYWLKIKRPEGDLVSNADGTRDKPVHARGPRGEMLNSLKTFEFIQPARIDFRLKVLGDSVKKEDLEYLLTYGGVHGYGGERGDGEGKYTFTLTEAEEGVRREKGGECVREPDGVRIKTTLLQA